MKTELKNHKTKTLEEFEDLYHPLHMYCRLIDLDIKEGEAKLISRFYQEKFYDPFIQIYRRCKIK